MLLTGIRFFAEGTQPASHLFLNPIWTDMHFTMREDAIQPDRQIVHPAEEGNYVINKIFTKTKGSKIIINI